MRFTFATVAAFTTLSVALALPAERRDGQAIHPGSNSDYCITVQGAFADGTPVVIEKCDGTPAQSFSLNAGHGAAIQLKDTNFCLDKGTGGPVSIRTCEDFAGGQGWQYKDGAFQADQPIGSHETLQCLENPNHGSLTFQNPIVTAPCAQGNENQQWSL